MKKLAVSLFALSLIAPISAMAASDGTLGTTSTGTSTISVTVPALIKITGVADLALGTWAGSGAMTGNDDVCIYTNKAAGNYRVTATGSGGGGAFTITDGSNTIAYTAAWNDVSGTTGQAALTSGTALNGQTGANTSSQTCGGSQNANFYISIAEAALLAAPSGAYSGTLTMVVEPV